MKDRVRTFLSGVRSRTLLTREFWEQNNRLHDLEQQVGQMREALGRIETRQLHPSPGADAHPAPSPDPADLTAREFRVYSQWGEDGILQHLVREVDIERKIFVEFGVESYHEANTRFLLVNNHWAGLVIDGNGEQIARLRHRQVYWLHNLKVTQAFITRENINRLLKEQGMTGPIGLLSIDIDGMDYWVWQALTAVEPAIVVIEYNYRFGCDAAVTVPHDAAFDRRRAHHSTLYYGASLRALTRLGHRKGYALVGVNSTGLNAFFVRRDLLPHRLPEKSVAEAYRRGTFSEYHDEQGRRRKISHEKEHELVMNLPLVEVHTDEDD